MVSRYYTNQTTDLKHFNAIFLDHKTLDYCFSLQEKETPTLMYDH